MQPIYDSDWKNRALAGNTDAIELLASRTLEPLYHFCFYRVGRDQHLCEEVVQETLVRAIRDLPKYDPERAGNDIFSWLSGLARNEVRRVLARQQHAGSLEAMWIRMDDELRKIYASLDAEPLADDVLVREETREMVNATMSQIPSHYRRALEEKYVQGVSVREIAESFSVSEKAAESMLTRARLAFRETFLALTKNLNLEIHHG